MNPEQILFTSLWYSATKYQKKAAIDKLLINHIKKDIEFLVYLFASGHRGQVYSELKENLQEQCKEFGIDWSKTVIDAKNRYAEVH